MFFGAVFKTIKGSYDAITIRKKLKKYKAELSEELLVSFPPYERFFARESLIMAEYAIALAKIKAKNKGARINAHLREEIRLRERVNQQMKSLIESAQKELEEKNATKLDVARIVTSLRELSIAVDRDLVSFRKEVQAGEEKLQSNINELAKKLTAQSERLDQQEQRAAVLEKKVQSFSTKYDGFSKEIERHNVVGKHMITLVWLFNLIAMAMIVFLIVRH